MSRIFVAVLLLAIVSVALAADHTVNGEAEVACMSAFNEASAECERSHSAQSGLRHACLERAELSFGSCNAKPVSLQSFRALAVDDTHATMLCEDSCVDVSQNHKYACESRRARDWDYCHATNDREPTNYMPTKSCLRRSAAIEGLCNKRADNNREGCFGTCGVTNSIHSVSSKSEEAPINSFQACLSDCDNSYSRSIEKATDGAVDARSACQSAHRTRDVNPKPYALCIDEVEQSQGIQAEAAEMWHVQCYSACEKKERAAGQREMAIRAEALRAAAERSAEL